MDLLNWRSTPNNRVRVFPSDSSFIRKGDGLASTLLLSENYDAGRWNELSEALNTFIFYPPGTKPKHAINGPTTFRSSPSFLNARPASFHPGGANAVFADGHGTILDEAMDYVVYCALMTPKGITAMEPGTDDPSPDSIREPPIPTPTGF